MSAFVVSKEHINAMVTAGLRKSYGSSLSFYHEDKRHELTDQTADTIGQMLLDENVKSVMYRYDDSEVTDLPGKISAEWVIPFKYRYTYGCPTGVETIKNVQCYKYQSCEHPEWEPSMAKAFCEALIHKQFDRLPGYEDAPWGWDKPITENLQRLV